MNKEGKRQRVFFLSDSAMERIKKRKEEANSPSINHALESMLTDAEKPACNHTEIIAQVKRFAEHYRIATSQTFPTTEAKNAALESYRNEVCKLAAMAEGL